MSNLQKIAESIQEAINFKDALSRFFRTHKCQSELDYEKNMTNPNHIFIMHKFKKEKKLKDSFQEIMNCFFVSHTRNDVLEYAKTTTNLEHLKFLCDFPNYAVLIEIAKNKNTSGDILHKLAIENPDVPPLLEIIKEHDNCRINTKLIIGKSFPNVKPKPKSKPKKNESEINEPVMTKSEMILEKDKNTYPKKFKEFKEFLEKVQTTKELDELWAYCDSSNYAVLMKIPENINVIDAMLYKLVDENPNVPPLLEIIEKCKNASMRTKFFLRTTRAKAGMNVH